MLIPVRANLESFTSLDLGLLGAAYFGVIALGCLFVEASSADGTHPHLPRDDLARVGVVLCHALSIHRCVVMLRMMTGFCFAVLTIIIESWINARATNDSRGAIFSVYTGINLSVITIGKCS